LSFYTRLYSEFFWHQAHKPVNERDNLGPIFTTQRSYASTVSAVVILSVCDISVPLDI